MLKWPARLFYGWKMVAVGSFTNAVGSAIYHTGFAIFFLPVSRDLNTTRAETSLIFSLSRAEGAIEGPLAGWLVDRFGPKPLLFGGALVTGIGFIALSRVDTYLAFMFVYLVVVSISYNAGFMHPVMTTVNSWFIRKRGLAFALTQASHNVGTAIGAPAIAFLVQEYGWRTAAVASAFALWLLVLPTSLLIVGSPEKLGMVPDGVPAPRVGTPGYVPAQRDFTVREALKTKAYWMLALATTLRGTMGLIYTWGAVVGPVAAGAIFDQTESYAPVLWGMVAFFMAAATVFILVRPPVLRQEEQRV